MSAGREFHVCGAATENARRASSVRTLDKLETVYNGKPTVRAINLVRPTTVYHTELCVQHNLHDTACHMGSFVL